MLGRRARPAAAARRDATATTRCRPATRCAGARRPRQTGPRRGRCRWRRSSRALSPSWPRPAGSTSSGSTSAPAATRSTSPRRWPRPETTCRPTVRLAVLATSPASTRRVPRWSTQSRSCPVGSRLALAALARATPPTPSPTCVDGGVLVVDGDADLSFRHELARLAIEGQLSAAARRTLHERAVAARLIDRRSIRPGWRTTPRRPATTARSPGPPHAAPRRRTARPIARPSATAEQALRSPVPSTPTSAADLRSAGPPPWSRSARRCERGARRPPPHWRDVGDDRRVRPTPCWWSAVAMATLGDNDASTTPSTGRVSCWRRRRPARSWPRPTSG